MDRLLLISSDGHASAPPEVFRPYLEEPYRDHLDELTRENERFTAAALAIHTFTPEELEIVDDEGAIASDGRLGAWDLDIRLREMDREGVAAELVIPGTAHANVPFFFVVNRPYPPELRAAGARAYHRWLADRMADAGGRLFAMGEPGPCHDLDETLRELRWIREHGFVSVALPGEVADPTLPPLHHPRYEPFWAACADLDLRLSIHAGDFRPQGLLLEFMERVIRTNSGKAEPLMAEVNRAEDSPLVLDWGPRRAMWQLMLGGVFDRHPSLRLAVTEVRVDWIPTTLAQLDRRFERGDTPLRMRPSEYWRRHCAAGASSIHRAEIEMRHEIGVEQIMFGRDYPHLEGTWPNTRDWIRAAFAGVPTDEARLMLGENALAFYGLDETRLRAIAERIGPRPSDVLGGDHHVDQRKLDHFDMRAAYARPAEAVDVEHLDRAFTEDLAAIGSRASEVG
jgi:predicted TIM-barrel fold metal-dependent hydrolase